MELFSRDQTELTEQSGKLIGQECVEEVLCAENPLCNVMDASGLNGSLKRLRQGRASCRSI
jgi:hypothetical protein